MQETTAYLDRALALMKESLMETAGQNIKAIVAPITNPIASDAAAASAISSNV